MTKMWDWDDQDDDLYFDGNGTPRLCKFTYTNEITEFGYLWTEIFDFDTGAIGYFYEDKDSYENNICYIVDIETGENVDPDDIDEDTPERYEAINTADHHIKLWGDDMPENLESIEILDWTEADEQRYKKMKGE